jgi:hypothetical protein
MKRQNGMTNGKIDPYRRKIIVPDNDKPLNGLDNLCRESADWNAVHGPMKSQGRFINHSATDSEHDEQGKPLPGGERAGQAW